MIDIAIIGAGPAGLSAAINAKARNKKVVVFGRKLETSWLYTAEKVDNHLGMPGLSGAQLLETFYSHAHALDIEIREGRVLQALPMGDYFALNFENEFVEARAIILATGIQKSKGVPGEAEFLGKGVSYCATCDGMLYRNKEVVIAGDIPEAEEDANFLAEICSKVTYVYNYGHTPEVKEVVNLVQGKVNRVLGEASVSAVSVGEDTIPCTGAFFIKEAMPPESLMPGLAMDGASIVVNRFMETNVPGVYAAGDCTGWPFQLSNAIGEGLIAAQQCAKTLSQKHSAQ